MDKWYRKYRKFYRTHKKMVWIFGLSIVYVLLPIDENIKSALTPLVMAAAVWRSPKNENKEDVEREEDEEEWGF